MTHIFVSYKECLKNLEACIINYDYIQNLITKNEGVNNNNACLKRKLFLGYWEPFFLVPFCMVLFSLISVKI